MPPAGSRLSNAGQYCNSARLLPAGRADVGCLAANCAEENHWPDLLVHFVPKAKIQIKNSQNIRRHYHLVFRVSKHIWTKLCTIKCDEWTIRQQRQTGSAEAALETCKGHEMAEDKSFEETCPEYPFSEMVWLSIKLACVLSSFEQSGSAESQPVESAEAIQSA